MKTHFQIMVFATLIFIGVSLLPGCTSSPPVPETVGDACFEVGQEFCTRAIECFPDGSPQHETCVSLFLQGCCLDSNRCGEDPLINDGNAWEECLLAFDNFSCQALGEGAFPLECIEASDF